MRLKRNLIALALALAPATLSAVQLNTGTYYYDPESSSQPAQPGAETPEQWYHRNYVMPRAGYMPASLGSVEVSDEGRPEGDGIYGNEYGANDESDLY